MSKVLSCHILESSTFQPIATDWEILYVTSFINDITAAPQTLTQTRSHHSSPSLHLTSPNLDLSEVQNKWVHVLCQRDFSLSQPPLLPRLFCLDSYSRSSQWTSYSSNPYK